MVKLSVYRAILKAKSHLKKGETSEAQTLYKAVLEVFPNNKKAQQALTALTKRRPSIYIQNPPQENINQLANLYNQGQLNATVKQAKKLTEQYTKAYIVWNILGAAQKGLNRIVEASESFKKVTELNPTYADGFNNLGVTLKNQGKLEEAIKAYSKAISIKPDYAIAHNNMGTALQIQGHLEEAIKAYNKSISIKPDYADAHNNMGRTLQIQGHMEEAIKSYKKALTIKPYADAYNNMGLVFKAQGKIEEAMEAYHKALSIKPDYADAYNNMGNALKHQKKIEEAIKAYNKAISTKPDYFDAHYNMGNALKDQDKLEEAIKAYKKALTIKPENNEAKHMLSALSGKKTNSAPREYVENLFDDYAYRFDQSLIKNLEYNIPKLVAELAVKKYGNGSLGSILDLGCGTGLAGLEINGYCSYLEGIDLSNMMLEQAKKKNVYDKLIHSDIVEYLSKAKLDFDYFISTDVFIYIGELSEVFRLIKSRNKKPGKLLFSTEHTKKDGFQLEKSGRYTHSQSYIKSLCRKFDYSISHFSVSNLRKEKDIFLQGGLYILDF